MVWPPIGRLIGVRLCCFLGQNLLLLQCLSPPRCINAYRQVVRQPSVMSTGEYLQWTSIPSRINKNDATEPLGLKGLILRSFVVYRTMIENRVTLLKLAPHLRRQCRQVTGNRYLYFSVGLVYSCCWEV